MFDTDLWWIFIGKILDEFTTLMTGGAIILVLGLLERYLGRPVTKKTFVVFGLMVIFFACFQVWRKEYQKTLGSAYFTFQEFNPQDAANSSLTFRASLYNDTKIPIEIEEIRLARIWALDRTPYLTRLAQQNWCKKINTSPAQNRLMGNQTRKWKIQNEEDAWYEYTNNIKITVDGADRDTEAAIIGPGTGHVYSITVQGLEFEPETANAVTLCPVLVWQTDRRFGIACFGLDRTFDPKTNGFMTRTTQTRYVLRSPNEIDQCVSLHFL